MKQRTKRLLGMFAKNLLSFVGIALLVIGAIMITALIVKLIIVKLIVIIWGQTVGLFSFGIILSLIGFGSLAFFKALEDLRHLEMREKHVMDTLRRSDDLNTSDDWDRTRRLGR